MRASLWLPLSPIVQNEKQCVLENEARAQAARFTLSCQSLKVVSKTYVIHQAFVLNVKLCG